MVPDQGGGVGEHVGEEPTPQEGAVPGAEHEVIAHRDGQLAQLTHDHSYVQELVDCGTITVEEAEHHPQKNIITRALGVDYRLEPEFTTAPLQKGDILLLCSDGLTNAVPKEQLEQLLRTGKFYDLPDLLIRTANENGGPDNITALLLCVEEVR